MKLIFLGTGSAFTIGGNFHSNMLLEDNHEHRMLIDCGSDARHSLHKAGYSHRDITDIYISHSHADHAGGLEWIGFTHKFDPSCDRPRLFANTELARLLWDHTLSGGMRSIKEHPTSLETYFDVELIEPDNPVFDWHGIPCEIVQAIHFHDFDKLMPCYGISFRVNGKIIYITADTQFTPDRLMPHYQKADLIFHDCETGPNHSGVHAHFEQLKALPDEIKRKMWLYHYQPGDLPDAVAAGFKGFVEPRQVFDLNDEQTYR